jgi:exopolysaccharide biosynthesis WecB/TagA/CpsF family protein
MSLATLVIGGVRTVRATRAELAEVMAQDARQARAGRLRRPRVVVSSNGSVIAAVHRNAAFRASIEQADIVDADGMPLVFATRLFCRHPLKERVATTDFVHDAAAIAARESLRFYLLGGRPGVAEYAAERLAREHPGLQVVGARDGYFAPAELTAILAGIRAAAPDVLWLGLGSPRQEALALELREQLPGVAWIRTCGGLFDHIGGRRRAPAWMQNAGLEWLHRAAQEPWRLGRRYLATNLPAAFHLLTETFEPRSGPEGAVGPDAGA